MAESSPYEKLARHVRTGRQSRGWSIMQLGEESFTSPKTITEIEHKRLDSTIKKETKRRQDGVARAVIRILHVLGEEDIENWLKQLQLPHDEAMLEGELKKLYEKKGIGADWLLEEVLTAKDLGFLSRIQKEFTQPMTIGFALELLRHRKQPTGEDE